MVHIQVATEQKRQVIDISNQVAEQLPEGSGIVTVFVRHTTAAITTADLDPGTDLDLLDGLAGILPDIEWRHPHNPKHTPDHLLASIVGPSVSVPYDGGKLLLGDWQRIILIEFDGPRDRKVVVVTTPE